MTIISDKHDSRKFICFESPLPGDCIINVTRADDESYYKPLSAAQDETLLCLRKLEYMEPYSTIEITPLNIDGFIRLTRNLPYEKFVQIVHGFDDRSLLESCMRVRLKAVQESESS